MSSEFGGEQGSWPEAFDNIRGAAPNHWPHLGPIQATRSYCERLEIEAAGLAKEDDEEELILPVLVLGMFFGDAIAKRFRGHWRYSEWTPGMVAGKQILGHHVELGAKSTKGQVVFPIQRVYNFVVDRAYGLAAMWDMLEAEQSGKLELEKFCEVGQEMNLGSNVLTAVEKIPPRPENSA